MSDKTVNPIPVQGEESSSDLAGEQVRSPYFTPRRLGATAPHDCSIWSVDYRDVGDGSRTTEDTRTLADESLTEQLQTLMSAGLQVRV